MNVMNIKHYLSAAAALALFAACSDYDPGISENAVNMTDAEIATIKEYTANFVERYGEMDPNHTWGFGELADMDEMGTRASEPRSNEWVKVVTGKGQKKDELGRPLYKGEGGTTTTEQYYTDWEGNQQERDPVPLYDGDVPIAFEKHTGAVAIPGFPVRNYYLSSDYKTSETVQYEGTQIPENKQGWYHFRFANSNKEEWFPSEESILQYMRDNHINDGIIPLGDVASCNTLTDAEVADVYAEFSKKWQGSNPAIDLKSYFVQQVWVGKEQYPYTNQDGSTGTMTAGKDNMDYLVAYGTDYTASDNEHFYNFNGANFSSGSGGMMLIYNSNTKNFAYHNSWMDEKDTNPGASTMWDHFRLVELHGNYYVGFDFESKGEYNKNIPRDHIYNDWIVKIIPGEGTILFDDQEPFEEEETVNEERVKRVSRRVMCEDLGETDDFDFNDVVFDVEYAQAQTGSVTYKVTGVRNKSTQEVISETRVVISESWRPKDGNDTWTGTITLRASGGTLPIYIENFDGTQYECHEKMGGTKMSETLYNPINVGTNLTKDAVTLPSVSGLTAEQTNPDDINIYVYTKSGEHAENKLTLPSIKGMQKFGTDIAPQKLCVPVITRWMKERKQIETTYDHFRDWVNKESDYDFGKAKDWTKYELKNTGNLF